MRVFVNGMGRIGRLALRQLAQHPTIDVVAMNDLSDYHQILHLIRYDSNYGIFTDIDGDKDGMTRLGRHHVQHLEIRSLAEIPLRDLGIDLVLECTGAFNSREKLQPYLDAGAPRILVSAPTKNADFTMVPGINTEGYDPAKHIVVSAASCTTNCIVPTLKALDETVGIVAANVTTVHAYTNDQQILDKRHDKDWRRARNAATNIIPTSSGAGKTVVQVMPHLEGKFHASALRVPVQVGSVIDCTISTRDVVTSADQINAIFLARSGGSWSKFFGYTSDPIVSTDIRGSDKAAIIDGLCTNVIDDHLIYALAWYDNEWGYTAQLIRAMEAIERAGSGATATMEAKVS